MSQSDDYEMGLQDGLAKAAKLRDALTALADQIELCGKESAGIFQIAAIHNCPYTGPNWVKELEVARAALRSSFKANGLTMWREPDATTETPK